MVNENDMRIESSDEIHRFKKICVGFIIDDIRRLVVSLLNNKKQFYTIFHSDNEKVRYGHGRRINLNPLLFILYDVHIYNAYI